MQCGNKSPRSDWNKDNPDQLGILKQQLAECHQLLNLINEAPYAALENIDIKTMASQLLAKHQTN